MEPDDLASFRAAHPSVAAAIARCDRPDWAIRLAFEAAPDRKAVIRVGASAARMLATSKLAGAIELVRPYPGALEVVGAWAGDTDRYSRASDTIRATTIAALIAGPLTYVGDRFVSAPRLDSGALRVLAIHAMFIAFTVVLARLIKRALARAVRRRVAQLDDPAALRIVVAMIARGMAKHPARIPLVMRSLDRTLSKLVDGARS